MAHKRKSNQPRKDMEKLPPDPKPIPDSFENVIKALVRQLAGWVVPG